MTYPPPPGQPPVGPPYGDGQYPPTPQPQQPYGPPMYQQPSYGPPQYPPPGHFQQPPVGYGYAPPARRLSEPLVGWLLVGVGALTMVAAALPWATVLGISVAGTVADGQLSMVCGAILAGLGVVIGLGQGALWVSITACVFGIFVALIGLLDVGSVGSFARHGSAEFLNRDEVSVGGGLWLTLIAGFAAVALSIVGMVRRPARVR
jgi:hypothetical protein